MGATFMQRIADWLEKLGMAEYAQRFAENDIDCSVLPHLTDRDLKELGVSLGHRRKLLASISEVGQAVKAMPGAEVQTKPEGSAERRQVTVLFCDLVGSTALAGSIDPELVGTLLRRYQDACAGAIGRFGGFVAKFMGDGVLAYFGFPRAFEDAAERAVRAALAITTQVGSIERPDRMRLQTRIGIATGLVVVGEIVGTGIAQERTIVGETPNLGARLQALAAPDTILVSETTRNLLGGLFELEATGDHDLKGFAGPVPAWRVHGEAPIESRFAAIRTRGRLPLIGRAHEMGLALDRWRLARLGEGQIVTVIGEPGIGKSRLLQALQETLCGEPHTRVYLQCSPYHSDSPLYPVIQHLDRAARFVATDPPSLRIEKLRSLLTRRAVSDPSAIPLLAELLSIPAPEETALLPVPAQRKAATIALLVDEIVCLSDADPVLLVLEDAHWIDATTLELMTRLIDSIASSRLLAVVTARPEFVPPWQARQHSTLLTLSHLGRAESTELASGIAASHGLSAETIDAIVAKTDGVPLFVEELTIAVLESAGEGDAVVPATLKDSLMARLDRLGEAREVAQIASVIGRHFAFALLDAVAPGDGAKVKAALAKLGAAGIVFPEVRGLEHSFIFKHALVRDTAYESLLLSRRREWHERVARVLEEQYSELAATEPELLAHHFGEAGLADRACDYRMRAGDRAVSRSAYKEAIAHFSTGLKLAEALAKPADRLHRQLDFLVKLGPALMVAHGMGSAEVEDACRRAAEIGAGLEDRSAVFQAKWGLWINANVRRRTDLARDRANELLSLARRSGDGDQLLEAYHCRWSTALFRGDVAATLDNSRVGVDTYDMAIHRHLGPAFGGHDPGVCAHVCRAIAMQESGDCKQAQASGASGTALAEALDHPNSLGHAFHNFGICLQLMGDRDATFAAADRAVGLAQKFGLVPWRAGSLLLTAWATAVGPRVADAARLVDAEIDNATATGPLPQYFLGLAAEVLLAADRPADALTYLDRTIAGVEEPGVGFYLPELHRLRGECLLSLNRANKTEARQAFLTARDNARQQGATLFERRAADRLDELGI
jgi:class 3 adenylate cyclase/predicted ATPase